MAVTDSDLESRPQGPKNALNLLMAVSKMSWASDRVAEMSLKQFSTWLIEAKS